MNHRHIGHAISRVTIAVFCLAAVSVCAAQGGRGLDPVAAAKPTPRMTDGHPDLTGFWANGIAGVPGYGKAATGAEAGGIIKAPDGTILYARGGVEEASEADPTQSQNQPPYKPEYMAKVKEIAATVYGTITSLDPVTDCKPEGVPRIGLGLMHVVANPKFIAMLYENAPGPQYRLIYTDGRQHPADLDTSYMGHSIGHWDGDTLVVDTVGLNDETWYSASGGGTKYTNIHSDKEHVIERITRKGNTLTYQATVEDPVMLSRPWVMNPMYTKLGPSDDYIQPQMCRGDDKAHLITPSDKDRFACDFCIKDPDAKYGQGATDEVHKDKSNEGAGQ